MANCIHCGAPLADGSAFCNTCGKKQAKTYTKQFVRTQLNSSAEIINEVNQWLDDNPNVANIKCHLDMKTGIGAFTNKWLLDSVVLEYEMFKMPNTYQYRLEEISSATLFSGFGINNTDQLLAAWKEKNPDKTVVYSRGGTHTRGTSMLIDVGNSKKIQSFVLYKQQRNNHQNNDTDNLMNHTAPTTPVQSTKNNKAVIIVLIIMATMTLLCGLFFGAKAIVSHIDNTTTQINSVMEQVIDSETMPMTTEAMAEAMTEAVTETTTDKVVQLSGSSEYDNMRVSFERMEDSTIYAHITNDSDCDYCFGWVNGKIVLTCESGKKYYINNVSPFLISVNAGFDDEVYFDFENYDGSDMPTSIEFKNTIKLNDRGLPENVDSSGSSFVVNIEAQ